MVKTKMEISFIALGTNLGDRRQNLENARNLVKSDIGDIILTSEIYETAPWGHPEQPDFLNQIIKVSTSLPAGRILKRLLHIEEMMGRIRTFKNAPRIIDLDILFYGNKIINEKNITIPHPAIAGRKFVLVPLSEIAPDFIHPVTGETIARMLKKCSDPLRVHKTNRPANTQLTGDTHYF